MNLSNKEIEYIIESIGGVVFRSPYLLNLLAIRDLNNPDEWNDVLIYFYYDNSGVMHRYEINEFTTDPGVKSLMNPENPLGTAIICEGWYRKLWILGTHKGYEALKQYSPIKVYRDSNKDGEFDLNSNSINEGIFGINLHRANVNSIASVVGPHSSGCCVVRVYQDWLDFLKVVHICRDKGNQKYFSLALVNKNDIKLNNF